MELFTTRGQSWVEAAIEKIEGQLIGNAQQITSPDGGGATYVTRSEAMKTLYALKLRLFRITGDAAHDPRDKIKRYTLTPSVY